MESSLQKRLLQTLQGLERTELPTFHVVMLPDFFVDHFISLDTVEKTCNAVKTVAAQGGGNLSGIAQRITQGGNAANTTLALARLGISAHLICRTDPLGMHLLQYFLGNSGVDLSGVKTDGNLAITTALEFQEHHANIMIGDPGSVATFTFELLNDHDRELITSADLVGVTNWNLNRSGTDLACKVFEIAKKHGVRTFFDSGDPSPRVYDIPELINKVLTNPQLDIFGLNENELRYYSNSSNKTQEEMISAAVSLKKKIPARIDLHTSLFSGSIRNTFIVVPTMSLSTVYRSTGAGDAWNAANLFADLLGFADDERLLFANMFAGHYISSPDVVHSTIDMLINSIKRTL
ncbi:MAG: carbohydrate kinase family protein [Thermoplasmata archaeon]|nr:carbohydrate kinase family protein [Thermoplasmata archaeon]MBE3137378.1 carbohydrate kinase family protein [Thermoplasmata archaeon]MBE3140951.1 carbohydrate kinase family protein [Thermoplasmata archaeon]